MLQKNIPAFHSRLHDWYAKHGRHHLPWRTTPDPYHIWVSEVMLQQTQVATVLARYYHPFLKKFPTIEALANAERETVMKAWEGLGYYRRAGFLHEAAKQLVIASAARQSNASASAEAGLPRRARNDGVSLPATVEGLLALPGIGRNTAHAIASFGFGLPVPVMEANLKRVLSRIFAWEKSTDTQLWDAAHQLFDAEKAFDYNQAMMDVGAQICLPRNPLCMLCPANDICEGKTNSEAYPAAKVKKEKPTRHYKLLLAFRTGPDGTRRYHMAVRETALLGGLYGFPQSLPEAQSWEHAGQSVSLAAAHHLGTVSHAFTHFNLVCEVWAMAVDQASLAGNDWYTVPEIRALPIAAIDKKALALLLST